MARERGFWCGILASGNGNDVNDSTLCSTSFGVLVRFASVSELFKLLLCVREGRLCRGCSYIGRSMMEPPLELSHAIRMLEYYLGATSERDCTSLLVVSGLKSGLVM